MIQIILIAIALSMDAFAVSIALGLDTHSTTKNKMSLTAGLFFGLFQGFMPLLSIFLCKVSETCMIYIQEGKIPAILLFFVGLKMFFSYFFENLDEKRNNVNWKYFVFLAFATSVDAFFVGPVILSLSFNFIFSILIIILTTFLFSYFGVMFGNKLGVYVGKKAELLGASILCVMAIIFWM